MGNPAQSVQLLRQVWPPRIVCGSCQRSKRKNMSRFLARVHLPKVMPLMLQGIHPLSIWPQ